MLNTIEASGQCLFTYLCIDLDPRVNTRAEFCMGMGMGHVSNTRRLLGLVGCFTVGTGGERSFAYSGEVVV